VGLSVTTKLHKIFCTCNLWPWLGPSLTTTLCRILAVFRLGRRHVFTIGQIQMQIQSHCDSPDGAAKLRTRGEVCCRRLPCFKIATFLAQFINVQRMNDRRWNTWNTTDLEHLYENLQLRRLRSSGSDRRRRRSLLKCSSQRLNWYNKIKHTKHTITRKYND